jgi:subtilisin family serine protease
MTVVVDAGNQGQNACDNSPGDVAGAITVGGTDYSNNVDSLWPQSNFGPCVDILAPALYLWAADNGNGDGDCGVAPDSTTGVCAFSGTSVAAPLVAGIAALYLQNYPNAAPATVKSVINSAAAQIPIVGVTLLSGTPS